jgi:transposase
MSFWCNDNNGSRRDLRHGKPIASGRALERDQFAVSSAPAFARGGEASHAPSRRADSHLVRPEDGHCLEGSAHRGIRLLVQDLYPTHPGVVAVGRVGANAQVVPEQVAWRRSARLVESARRLQPSEGPAGRAKTGPNPTDRGRSGSKHCLLTDAKGIPLVIQLEAANRHDVNTLLPLVVNIPPVAGKPGRPKQKPAAVVADKAFDCQSLRDLLHWLGIKPQISKRGDSNHGLGKFRWFVERTISWLHQFRRLRIRWERSPELHQALLSLAAAIICYRMWINEM